MLISVLDSIALLGAIAALVFVAIGWKRIPGGVIRSLLASMLAVGLLHIFLTWEEWVGIRQGLEGWEDFTGALLPMLWAFLFYAWIQHGLQADLRRSEQNMRITLDSIGDAVIATDSSGRVTRLNPVAEHMTGWRQAEAVGQDLVEVFPIFSARDGARVEDPVAKVLATGAVIGLANHTQLLSRDGSRRHIADSAAPIRNREGTTVGVVLVFRDVSEEYRLRERLVENEERLALALDGSGLGSWDWDMPSGRVVFDERWATMLGERLEDLESSVRTWKERIHPDDRERTRKALDDHLEGRTPAYESEHRLATRDGGWCWVLDKGRVIERDDEGRPLRMCGTHLDLSERKRIEERAKSSARLEAVGRLAGGVAHDLNNLLTPILGYAELLAAGEELSEEGLASTNEIQRAACSARDLVRQLLAFGRRQDLRIRPLDLNEIIARFANLLRRTIPESIEILSDLTPDLPPILADAGQLEQILMNLVVNSADAMPDGGLLEITTSIAPAETGGDSTQHVRLRVRDNGRGMEGAVLDQVFEPFFSTKGDEGTGLGLATVHGIVRQHGGRIRIDSQPGGGTTVEILLPVTEETIIEAPASGRDAFPRGRGETVLLVEDNDMVRQLARALLEHQGYKVVSAVDGAEALEFLERDVGVIALLLADVVMPGLSGRQLLEHARRLRPDLRALFMSGYTEDVLSDHGALGEDLHLLMKPFSTQELAREVRATLDR